VSRANPSRFPASAPEEDRRREWLYHGAGFVTERGRRGQTNPSAFSRCLRSMEILPSRFRWSDTHCPSLN
jgi:hypothetical protein